MGYKIKLFYLVSILLFSIITLSCEKKSSDETIDDEAKRAMLQATKFMVEKVSNNGGYVWYYLPDFSRRWGEMEAYKTMIWLQHPGTISMGHLFLDAYRITHNEYYYEAAEKAARAVIWGQGSEGGWNYIVDFAGDRSLKEWYNTIGKNGWRMEEFQHYYGNSTFDDNITSDAARFLLRMYLEKLDPSYKPSLDKAIDFIMESQYEIGGWPQRYPLMYDFKKNGNPDYTSFYTFNDEVIFENINFLIQCYLTLGEARFINRIVKGMEFMLLTQQENGAWGQQYDMDLQPTGARTYEPKGLLTHMTYENALIMLSFFEYTGDQRFADAAKKAMSWLEKVKLKPERTENGKHTHPSFIDIETGQPIYVHRKGSNVTHGYYYVDNNDTLLLGHSRGKTNLSLDFLKERYDQLTALSKEELTKNSPLIPGKFVGQDTPQKQVDLNFISIDHIPDEPEIKSIIDALDDQHRWLDKHPRISHPYSGDGVKSIPTDEFASTLVGDETDTSPFVDTSDQEYISTQKYIENMRLLINYLAENNQ